MPSIAAVAGQLVAADLPALFLNTCVLLDAIRSIERCNADCAAKARELLIAASVVPKHCTLVFSRIVDREWHDHHSEKMAAASRHLTSIEEQSRHFHDVCGALGIVLDFGRANYGGLGVAERLHDLSLELLGAGVIVDSDSECMDRAFERLMNHVPPSTRGGEVKDCIILEEYLAVCRHARAAGFQKKLVLCTSNVRDYCDGGDLHAALGADFLAAGLRFTTNLGWGFYDVLH